MSNFCFVLFVGLYLIVTIKCNKNNVCPTFRDYYNKENNPLCWYDPDVFSNVNDILKRHNYKYEVHKAITPDGYILNVYRLPPKRDKSKGLVFLSHPALSYMISWIDKGKKSIAFLLVEAGYDVWLGNFRGTPYSQKHVTLSRTDQPNEFFNYSFHEMGIYDIPAQLELVRNISGSKSKIYYIGHSLGTTTAYIYASMLPKHAKEYIHLFVLWAPAVYLNIEKSIYSMGIPFANIFSKAINLLRLTNVYAYNRLAFLLYYICFEFPKLSETCGTILDLAFGLDPGNASPSLFPSLLVHNGYSFSLKATVHYLQIYKSGRFQWFDYGKSNNYYYNSPIPPEYPVENIKTPMYFFYGTTDAFAPVAENLRTYNMLRPEFRYGITELGYNHVNFMYGKNLTENIFLPTIRIIENFQKNVKYPNYTL